MGAKRAVPGRSKPFDVLLTEFQKRKEARIKAEEQRQRDNPKASKASNQAKAFKGSSGNAGNGKSGATATGDGSVIAPATKKKKTGEGKTGKGKAAARNKADLILGEVDDPPEGSNVEEEAPDSDDEVDQLLQAMQNSKPKPLANRSQLAFVRSSNRLNRYRDTFLTAFTGRIVSATSN